MGRFQPTRAFYIPEGATEQKHDDLGVVLYLYDSNKGAPAAMCFTGRAQKPTWCYRFKDADHRATYIAETLDARRIALDLKAKARAEAHQPCTLTPDDILVSSWGYEQTNVDFYRVLEVKGKRDVIVQRVGHTSVSQPDGSMSGYVVPSTDITLSGPTRYRTRNGNRITISSFQSASAWDGKPCYRSWYY